MADDKPPTDRPPTESLADESELDPKRTKRPPPTLDLSATEIPRASDPADPVPPIDEPNPTSSAEPAPESAKPPRKQSTILIPALAGAAAASFIMILISLAGWPVGTSTTDVTPPTPANTAALDELAARLTRIEARPVAASAPAAAPAAPLLTPRIDTLDKAVAALRDDVAAARTRAEQASSAVSELKAAPPPAAPPPPDLSAINSRLAQIESAIKTQANLVAQQIARESAKPADDAPLRRVVAAALLDMQIRQGQPYVAALQAVSLGADAARVAPLQTFAATGIPTAEALGRELLALLPKLTPPPAATTTTGTGIIDRLQAGAARLVKIESGDTAGSSGSAVVTRAADAARRNDLTAARRELATLPAPDRAIVQPWIDRADTRDLALAASQQFATDAMTALARPLP